MKKEPIIIFRDHSCTYVGSDSDILRIAWVHFRNWSSGGIFHLNIFQKDKDKKKPGSSKPKKDEKGGKGELACFVVYIFFSSFDMLSF